VRPRPRAVALLAFGLAFSLSTAPVALLAQGTLYIVGGGPQPAALVEEFVQLAGGPKARILVFGMASVAGERGGEAKASDLRALGAEARNVWIDRAAAETDSIARLIAGASGVWFGGGDQNRLARVLRGTKAERAIHARFRAGAVIGGTSAGAAVMSAVMITGDERRPGGARPDSTLAWGTIDRANVATDSGFALIGEAVIDQHFLRRRRHNRLISLVLAQPPHLGAGIDESTALLVRPDGTWEVRGASVVVIYDARRARIVADTTVALGGSGILMHVLPAGSRYDPSTGQVTIREVAGRP
jgi:cyanophycinase